MDGRKKPTRIVQEGCGGGFAEVRCTKTSSTALHHLNLEVWTWWKIGCWIAWMVNNEILRKHEEETWR